MNIQGLFPLRLTSLISLLSKGLLRVFSNTTIQKHQFFVTQPSLWSSSLIYAWLPEKAYTWLCGPLLVEWCLCFLICWLPGHLMQRTDLLGKTLCWERSKTGGEGADRGWDIWMTSLTQWTWVWASSGRWWGTGKPGMLQSMESQRVRHDWVTEQQQLLWWKGYHFWCWF